jgi:hypothetical protein
LILIAPAADDPAALVQKQIIASRADAVDDRRLRVYELYRNEGYDNGKALSGNKVEELRRRLVAGADARELILIGLDGGIKSRSALSTPLQQIFTQIDGMPMRQYEMQQKRRDGLPVTRP